MTERSLGDPAETPDEVETVTASQFAAGVRPGRARVKIRHNLHLYPRLQELADLIEVTADEDVDPLLDEFDDLRARMETVFVLERRSSEWMREASKRLLMEMGISKGDAKVIATGKAAGAVTDEQMTELGTRLVAEQVVEPEVVTWETLRDLVAAGAVDTDGRRVDDALALALQELNAGRFEALALDFSRRRSTTRRKRRSSTR